MEQNNKWSSAALNGLLLSLATIVYSLLVLVIEPKGFVSILLWIIKFAATNYLLYYFMKQYSSGFDSISYSRSFNYGFIVSVFSAIVCACFTFISMTFIFKEQSVQLFEQVQQAISARGMSADEEEIAQGWMARLPEIILFASLVYYSIYGAIASSIIANYTKKTNPFTNGVQE